MTNEAAERLRDDLRREYPQDMMWYASIDNYEKAVRRATVERIRERLIDPREHTVARIRAILDEEAAR